MEQKKKDKAGYFNYTMVMMNGQLATGIIEQVWGKLKKGGNKRSLLMLVFAMFRIAAQLAGRSVLATHKLKRKLTELVREQSNPKGISFANTNYYAISLPNLLCDITSQLTMPRQGLNWTRRPTTF